MDFHPSCTQLHIVAHYSALFLLIESWNFIFFQIFFDELTDLMEISILYYDYVHVWPIPIELEAKNLKYPKLADFGAL